MILVKGLQRYQRSKLEVEKNICRLAQFETNALGASWVGEKFFLPPTLTSDIFVAPWPKSMFSTSFERSITYLFEDRSLRIWYDF